MLPVEAVRAMQCVECCSISTLEGGMETGCGREQPLQRKKASGSLMRVGVSEECAHVKGGDGGWGYRGG